MSTLQIGLLIGVLAGLALAGLFVRRRLAENLRAPKGGLMGAIASRIMTANNRTTAEDAPAKPCLFDLPALPDPLRWIVGATLIGISGALIYHLPFSPLPRSLRARSPLPSS